MIASCAKSPPHNLTCLRNTAYVLQPLRSNAESLRGTDRIANPTKHSRQAQAKGNS